MSGLRRFFRTAQPVSARSSAPTTARRFWLVSASGSELPIARATPGGHPPGAFLFRAGDSSMTEQSTSRALLLDLNTRIGDMQTELGKLVAGLGHLAERHKENIAA